MALSDYESMMFNSKGQPCSAILTKEGTMVSTRKTWLYVHNKAMWDAQEKKDYIDNIIASINAGGSLQLAGVRIVSAPTDNRGMMFLVTWTEIEDLGKDRIKKYIPHFAGGICSCAYRFRIPKHLKNRLKNGDDFFCLGGREYIDKKTKRKRSRHCFVIGNTEYYVDRDPVIYTGITPKMFRNFIKWASKELKYSDEGRVWIEKIRNKAHRYNQGDKFILNHFGYQVQATKPGEAKASIISSLWK